MEWLFSGIWWIDALRVLGFGFLALLVLGFTAWVVADRFRWRRTDAAEMARLSPKATEPKEAKR